MTAQSRKAEAFRALHHQQRALVLPNAWDVPSARVFEDAGFPAVATSSAGLMVSLGFPDGEKIPFPELARTVARIAERLSVPLSADVVAGYGRTPRAVARTVRAILRAGAIGINLEDLDPRGGRLLPVEDQVAKLASARRVGESMGIPLLINARTDALRHAPGDERSRFREAVDRAQAYRDAGADCVYPMGLTDSGSISKFVGALRCPVNVMVRKGLAPLATLEQLGVKRVSFGPSASYATMGLLRRISEEILAKGTFTGLTEGAISFDELNRLAARAARPRRTRPGPGPAPR